MQRLAFAGGPPIEICTNRDQRWSTSMGRHRIPLKQALQLMLNINKTSARKFQGKYASLTSVSIVAAI
jgi:hypothetical protein